MLFEGSTFIYIEASKPAMKDNNAWLASPVIPSVSDSNKLCFQFRYHMFGTAIGSLNIKIYDGELKNVWTISGNQGDQWHAGQVPIPYGTNQRVRYVPSYLPPSLPTCLPAYLLTNV